MLRCVILRDDLSVGAVIVRAPAAVASNTVLSLDCRPMSSGGGPSSLIDKLTFLLALARERHFGRAAETCGVTQPTLSSAVKSLEETLGILIVERGSRFRGFTPEGERVLAWARRIVADSRAMRAEAQSMRTAVTGTLRLAVVPTALRSVSDLTVPFAARHPGVRLAIVSRSSIQILDELADLESDAGISYIDNEPLRGFTALPLYRERYCLVVPPTSPLAGRDEVSWAEAAAQPLCLLTPDMQNRRIVDRFLASAGASPEPRIESNSMIVLIGHVLSGQCASIMPDRLAAWLATGTGAVVLPIAEPASAHTIGLLVPHREPLAPMVEALVAEARRLTKAGTAELPIAPTATAARPAASTRRP